MLLTKVISILPSLSRYLKSLNLYNMQISQQKAHQLPKQLVRYVFPCETLGEMCYFIILLTQLSLLK